MGAGDRPGRMSTAHAPTLPHSQLLNCWMRTVATEDFIAMPLESHVLLCISQPPLH